MIKKRVFYRMQPSELHEIQVSILKKLGYEEEVEFSELQGDYASNKIAFHLNQLKDKNLIEKTPDEKYTTTKNGREVVIEFLGEETTKPVVLLSLVVFKDDKVYLEKQTSPLTIFKDMYRLPTGKVRTRERLKETSKRVYKQEFGEEPDSLEHLGSFDKKVTLRDGVEQKYLLYYLKTKYKGDQDENFYPVDRFDSMEIIPGVDTVIKEVYYNNDKKLTGEWEVIQRDVGEFDITRFDI